MPPELADIRSAVEANWRSQLDWLSELVAFPSLRGREGPCQDWLARWRDEGFGPIRMAWLARAIGLGEPIQVRLERNTLAGIFVGLDDDGALMLDMPSGSRRIAAGEVFPVSA